MDVEEFGDIVMAGKAVFLLEAGTDGRALLDNDGAFVRKGLAGALRGVSNSGDLEHNHQHVCC